MPELPEVERARRQLEALAKGKTISRVVTNEDTIVFSGLTHAAFATSCEGKVVKEVKRKGKNFYMVLSSPPHPIFHFGMSGTSQINGTAAPTYRVPRAKSDVDIWPPKYMKTSFTFSDDSGAEVGEWAFSDARRLGRIKMADAEMPEEVPPLSLLGADALLEMPSVEILATALTKRNAPIKAVLLDQNGPISGIGNWMVDEILYQSRLHPSHPASALTAPEIATLHFQIHDIARIGCEANANADLFPKDWLFSARWGKGKKGGHDFILPSGEKTKITFVTVGGRTSAVVEEVQKLPAGMAEELEEKKRVREEKREKGKRKADDEEEKVTSPYFKRSKNVDPPSPSTFKLPESLVSPTKSPGPAKTNPRKAPLQRKSKSLTEPVLSAFSSPASLLTVQNSSTAINVLSLLKITAGLGAFIAPAFFTSRAFGFSASKGPGGVSVGTSIGANTTQPGDTAEQSIAIRLFGARDIGLGLLLRDSTAAVVARALQIGVVVDALDVLAAGMGFIEGNLSAEVATAVAGVAAVTGAAQLYILNRA